MTTATSREQPSARPPRTLPPPHALPRRTIAVTARTRSRFARLRVRYPSRTDHPRYDAVLASELLGRTSELPASKHDLVVVITEYRYALNDLITALAGQSPAAFMNSALEQTAPRDQFSADAVA